MAELKRIAITGPTGAIGVAIIKQMISKDVEVLAICNPMSKRLDRLPQSPLLKIIKCDLNNLESVPYEDDKTYDVFYHLGWSGTTGDARNDVYLQNENVKYALDAVNLAKKLGCHTFIGAGSQAEYGRFEGDLNAHVPVNPENGYGMAKLCAGMMTRLQCQSMQMRHIWFRVLSVYGPYDGENSMVMSMIKKMLNGESPDTTRGEQIWDYLYSADAAKAFYLAALHGKDGAIYCLGSGKGQPLKEYINKIRCVVNENIKVNYGAIPYGKNQVMHLCADISDLKNDTGFEPEMKFEDGIYETLNWYREMQNEKN